MQKNQLYKGSLSTVVLKLLTDNEKMYGYQITREVEKITAGEMVITEGALYPTLHKLEAKGLLSVEIKKVNNRPRKYYFLTENGKKETVSLLNEMKAFIQNMDVLLNPKTSFDV
ncbi:PadR family transcriptional regulator [Maribellus comscasis]|uniref:PadR family transcriptional regulator n=1 Tax=Maribellus comscasis TaxID=2681766 RepID=A0A6I6K0A2_9BACT|nr:PadR family transcriptional regulator [Maribellus comscasis]QGY44823.1 PadR family transcriptional regulator [Maribellus comscasis]